jgi:hypothetical protein
MQRMVRSDALTGAGRQRLSQAHHQAAKTELWIDEVLGATRARQLVDMLRTLGDGPPPDRSLPP